MSGLPCAALACARLGVSKDLNTLMSRKSFIQAPTMAVFGDAGAVPPAHAAEFSSKARLALLPGVTHYNRNSSPALVPAVHPF